MYRSDILGGELVVAVCALDAVGKLFGGEIGKIQAEHTLCTLNIRHIRHGGDIVKAHLRNLNGDKQSAVGRDALGNRPG